MGVEGTVVMALVMVDLGVFVVVMAFVIVGLGVFVVVGVAIVSRHADIVLVCDRLDAVGRHHPDTAEVRSLDQTVQPAFELQPVDDKNPRFADGLRIGRGRLVSMRVSIGADERRDRDVLAANSVHHVAEDREGGDHRNRFVGPCIGRRAERQGEYGDGGIQKRSAGEHG